MSKKVLILESNFIVGLHIKNLLKDKGFEVYDELLSVYHKRCKPKNFEPDCIIIDQRAVLKKLSKVKEYFLNNKKIQLVIMNCLQPVKLMESDFSNNRIEYIEKPFIQNDIINSLMKN